jgi:hypothetical protein
MTTTQWCKYGFDVTLASWQIFFYSQDPCW